MKPIVTTDADGMSDTVVRPLADARQLPPLSVIFNDKVLLTVETRVVDDTMIEILVTGELDALTVSYVSQCVDDMIRCQPSRLTVDVSDLTFIGVAGLSLLVEAYENTRCLGVEFTVRGVSSQSTVSRLLKIIGFGHVPMTE